MPYSCALCAVVHQDHKLLGCEYVPLGERRPSLRWLKLAIVTIGSDADYETNYLHIEPNPVGFLVLNQCFGAPNV